MALSQGTRLGAYEISDLLGVGGMGEVYRAHDTKLNRQVAIKVLAEAHAADPDRSARFHREAQAVAALNDPNIAAIYDLAESDGTKFLVLELVEGDTLADRIKRGSVAVEDALAIVTQILEALEAAHAKGICHRDLKPANVKLTPDGTVKVLDFGLAKFLQGGVTAASSLSLSPTLSVAGTYPGVILGTAGYMSPEQAKGFEADHRSDIFSVGCILYELLTGRRAFDGETASEILASVLKIDVDWSALPPNLNPRLVEVLRRCLEKNPKRRWHAAADVRLEIESLMERALLVDEPRVDLSSPVVVRPLWKRTLPVMAGVLVGGLVVGAGIRALTPEPVPPLMRFAIAMPEGQRFTHTGRQLIAFSPDGSSLVYVANQRLYLRAIGDLHPREIAGSANVEGVMNPVFSPDGEWVAFHAAGDATIKRIAVNGGAAVTICSATPVYGMSWGDNGIVFGQAQRGIVHVSPNGGVPAVIVPEMDGELLSLPQLLPGGQALLFSAKKLDAVWDSGRIDIQVIGGARKTLIDGATDGRYLSTGHLIYARAGVLLAAPFDLKRLELVGRASTVVEGVRRAGLASTATATTQFTYAETGALAYLPGPTAMAAGLGLALFTRGGDRQLLKMPAGPYRAPRVSPDGALVAFDMEDEKDAAVWIAEISGAAAARRLTFGGKSRSPVWSPDGQWVAFQTDRAGDLAIFRQRADGSGIAERMTKPENGAVHIPQSWSSDGAHLLFTVFKDQQSALWLLSIKENHLTQFGDVRGSGLTEGAFSPDGRWIAYQVNESGDGHQVFIQPFPATGAKYLVRQGGHPYWTPKGDGLILNTGPGDSVLVPVKTTPGVSFGQPVNVARRGRTEEDPGSTRRNADAMPDGERILGVASDTPLGADIGSEIIVVVNWLDEVKRRAPRP